MRSKIRPFKKVSHVTRLPGLKGVSGTPQQPKGGKPMAVIPETDFVA